MKRKIMVGLLFSLISVAYGQNNSINMNTGVPTKVNPNVTQPLKVNTDYTPDQIIKMNELLRMQQYDDFFSYISSFNNITKDNYIKYLQDKKYEGHVPLYWLMAEYYAKENNPKETHKWYYIALIMTQQDSYLCSDRTARGAPRKLMKFFPESLNVVNQTPQFIDNAMREVIYFIDNLKNRSDPKWACYYGEQTLQPGANLTIQKEAWPRERQIVFKRFTEKYQK